MAAERQLMPVCIGNGLITLWLAAAIAFVLLVLTPDATLAHRRSRTRRLLGPVELHNSISLQAAFRRDQGKIRMVVLVSPT